MKKLTPKQDKFCRLVASGTNYSAAYRQAYDTEKMKAATVDNSAYKLLRSGDITARIEELRKELTEDLKYTRRQSFDKLCEIQKEAIQLGEYAPAIKAEELKGKLAGLYEDKNKVNITGQNIQVVFDSRIKKLL